MVPAPFSVLPYALPVHVVGWSSTKTLQSGLTQVLSVHRLIACLHHVPLLLAYESFNMNSYSYFFLRQLFYSYHYKEQLAQWVLIHNTHAYGEA